MEIPAQPNFNTLNPNNVTPPPLKSSKNFKEFVIKNKVKLILGVLALVIILELIFGSRMLFSPQELNVPATKVESLSPAQIVLATSKNRFKVGEKVPVEIRVISGGQRTDSTDVILKYDPKLLSASGSAIKIGKIYEDYPVAALDAKTGIIKISGANLTKNVGFAGIGTFATVEFTPLALGTANLSLEFNEGQTADSNVVLAGSSDDILGGVHNLNFEISNSSQNGSVDKPNACDGYTQYCITEDGKTGTQFCRAGRSENNACVFDPLLTLSCSVCKI